MRVVLAVLLGLTLAPLAAAEEKAPAKRHGVEADPKTYPQATPKEALASVLKAVEDRRIDYVVAQLSDPDWVDRRVKETGGNFKDLVEDATGKLVGDPGAAKLLQRFLKEGEWQTDDKQTTVTLKDVKERCVYLRQRDGRWFFESRNRPEPDKP